MKMVVTFVILDIFWVVSFERTTSVATDVVRSRLKKSIPSSSVLTVTMSHGQP